MSLYLDASVLVPLLVEETTSDLIVELMRTLDRPPLVSMLAAGEVESALSRNVRMSRLTVADVQDRLLDFDQWLARRADRIETEATDIHLAAAFVRRMTLNLRMPDAIHLATVARHGLTPATLDRRLADAARSLDLRVVVPE